VHESVQIRRPVVCSVCASQVKEDQAAKRRQRSYDWVSCCVCDAAVSLRDAPTDADPAQVSVIDQIANARRDRDVTETILEGKIATNDFDVFL
jgi:hypothetical protein